MHDDDNPAVRRATDTLMQRFDALHPDMPEFRQAVVEVVASVMPLVLARPEWRRACILEQLIEPERVVRFRVTWHDDQGQTHVHRAWRVQYSAAIGPYKGGLRFVPDLTLDTLSFLGFEQTLKNSLTGLSLGGAKGGANFSPKGRTDNEIRHFCQAMMTELARHIGERTDIPAGDIGVGAREIGFLFGQYRRIKNAFGGALTGKDPSFGGSPIRTEATGYGVVYLAELALAAHDRQLEGLTAAVSGAGNVALHCIEKLLDEGVKVVTASDSDGFVHDPDGIDRERLDWLRDLKLRRRGRIHEYAEHFDSATFHADCKPWQVDEVDLAFPCATQNELDADDARQLVERDLTLLAEGANMPCTAEAADILRDAGVIFLPGKAANAGGVAVSGFERTQNLTGMPWSAAEVDRCLGRVMKRIHDSCCEHAPRRHGDVVDYAVGANRAGFVRVAEAMLAQA